MLTYTWPQSKDPTNNTSQKFGQTYLLLVHTLYNSNIVVIILILIRIISSIYLCIIMYVCIYLIQHYY